MFPYKNNMEIALKLYEVALQQGTTCIVCNKKIDNPDDFISTGYLTSDCNHPLFEYNFQIFHKQCTAQKNPCELMPLLLEFKKNSNWYGNGLDYLINTIKNNM